MKPLPAITAAPIFAHESTALYHRVRELHGFAAELETAAGTSRYYAALVHIGLLAMFSTASAGVAPTERTRTRHLAKLRDQLARFASALCGMADRGLIEGEVAVFGSELVREAESLIHEFTEALLDAQSARAVDESPAEDSDGSPDKMPFHDENGTSKRPAQPLSRGARRIRHVDDPIPTQRRSDALLQRPQRTEASDVLPMATGAHNDERSIADVSQVRATNKPVSRRARASETGG